MTFGFCFLPSEVLLPGDFLKLGSNSELIMCVLIAILKDLAHIDSRQPVHTLLKISASCTFPYEEDMLLAIFIITR